MHPNLPRDRPKVPHVLALLDAYMSREEHIIGGSLKVFLDGNITTGHLEGMREWAWGKQDCAGVAIIDKLMQMTRTQRSRVCDTAGYPLLDYHRAPVV